MNNLITFDLFTARRAVRELTLEKARLKARLAEANQDLLKRRTEFSEALQVLATRRTPLEYRLAECNAELVRLGGKGEGMATLWGGGEQITNEEREAYQQLFRRIVKLILIRGDCCNPALFQEAKQAMRGQDFSRLYQTYRLLMAEEREPMPASNVASTADCLEGERRILANEIWMLRLALTSTHEQLNGITSHPYYQAWRSGTHDAYIEALCDQLRRKLVGLERQATELRLRQSTANQGEMYGHHAGQPA